MKTGLALILDDEQDLVDILSDFMADLGWKTAKASTLKEAEAQLKENKFDLLLSDYHLAETKVTPSIIQEIQNRYPGLKAVIISGNAKEEIIPPGTLNQNLGYLGKPFSPDSISAALKFLWP